MTLKQQVMDTLNRKIQTWFVNISVMGFPHHPIVLQILCELNARFFETGENGRIICEGI